MDFCAGLTFFGIGLFFFALLGHGVWRIGAAILRSFVSRPAPTAAAGEATCPRCGMDLRHDPTTCLRCGFDVASPLGRGLLRLSIAAREIEALVRRGDLDESIADSIFHGLEQQQVRLLRTFNAPPTRLHPLGPTPLPERIERLLSSRQTVESLTESETDRVLLWLDRLELTRIGELPVAILWKAAQILKARNLPRTALAYFEAVAQSDTDSPLVKPACLEAANYALQLAMPEVANRFLKRAEQESLSGQEGRFAESVREALVRREPTPAAAVPIEIAMTAPPAAPSVLTQPISPALPSTAPAPPRRSFQDMLQSFMEERNILWGELVGGILIVGCSIALVISLWTTLERIPYFPFLIFAALTSTWFAAGRYTLNHWKLEATSRGLLVIANLFVALDFLVLAGLAKGRDWGLLDGGLAVLAIVGFSILVWQSGRILLTALPGPRVPAVLLAVGVVGAAASQVVVARWLSVVEPHLAWFLVLSLAPIVFHLASGVGVFGQFAVASALAPRTANHYLLFLGQTTFAVLVALAFMVYASERPADTFRHLAVALAAAGLPLLLAGALVRTRVARHSDPASSSGPSVEHVRTIGTILSLTATGLMLLALLLGWPRPLALLMIGLGNAAAFFLVAMAFALPSAHVPALLNLAVAFVLGVHGLRGDWPSGDAEPASAMLALLGSPASGCLLAMLAAFLAFSSEMLARTSRRREAIFHGMGACLSAAAAATLVLQPEGFLPERAALVLLSLGLTAVAANLRWRVDELHLAGAGFVFLGILHVVAWIEPSITTSERWLWSLLTHATLFLPWGEWGRRRRGWIGLKPWRVQVPEAGVLSALAAVLPLVQFTSWPTASFAAAFAAWLAALLLLLALSRSSAAWLIAFQAMLVVVTLEGTAGWLAQQPWVGGKLEDVFHVWSLQAFTLALAGLALAMIVLRDTLARIPRLSMLFAETPFSVAWGLTAGLVIGHALILGTTLAPLLARESVAPAWPLLDAIRIPWLFVSVGFAFTFLVFGSLIALERCTTENATAGARRWFVQPCLALMNLGLALVLGVARIDWDAGPPVDLTWAWVTLGLTVAGILAHLRHRADTSLSLIATLGGLTTAILLAHHGREANASASALRWSLAAAGFLGAALLWARRPLRTMGEHLGLPTPSAEIVPLCRGFLLTATLGPLLLLTTRIALLGLQGLEPAGPQRDSFFGQMGWTLSMVAPLGLAALTLLGHGARENRPGYVLATGFMLLYAVVGGYALHLVQAGVRLDDRHQLVLAQVANLTLGGWLVFWLVVGRWRSPVLLGIQAALAGLGNLALLGGGAIVFDSYLGTPLPPEWGQLGRELGWLSWTPAVVGGVWCLHLFRPTGVVHGLALGGVGACFLMLWTVAPFDDVGWFGYHASLGLAVLLTAAFTALAGNHAWFPRAAAHRWVTVSCAVVVFVTLGRSWDNPLTPLAPSAGLLAVAFLFGVLALQERPRQYVFASGLMLPLAGFVLWQSWTRDALVARRWNELFPEALTWFLCLEIVAFSAGSFIWSLIQLVMRRLEPLFSFREGKLAWEFVAVRLAFAVLAAWIVFGVAALWYPRHIVVEGPYRGLAWLAVLAALGILRWDPESRARGLPDAQIVGLGVLAVGLGLIQMQPSPNEATWWTAVALAGYLVLLNASALSLRRRRWNYTSLGLPARPLPWTEAWWGSSQSVFACLAIGLAVAVTWPTRDVHHGLGGALTLAFLTAASLILTRGREGRRLRRHPDALSSTFALQAPLPLIVFGAIAFGRVPLIALLAWVAIVGTGTIERFTARSTRLRSPGGFLSHPWTTLGLGLMTVTLLGWSWYDASLPVPLLHRSIWLLMVLVPGGVWYASGLRGLVAVDSSWRHTARSLGRLVLGVAGVLTLLVFLQEMLAYDPAPDVRTTPLVASAKVLLTALLVASLIGALVTALSSITPRPATDRLRSSCVWAAEAIFVLLLVHFRLNVPDIFPSFLGRNWTLVLSTLGFGCVFLGEWSRRRNLPMLAGPLHVTGLCLPLVPLSALMLRPMLLLLLELRELLPGLDPMIVYLRPDRLPDNYWLHASLWFWYGMLWALVAALRRQAAAGLVAALAFMLGFWVVLANQELLSFFLHPQLWLIPLGVIVLVAEALHRDRLGPRASQSFRYFGLMLIFVSSAADLFLAGLGNSVLLPLALAILSVLGVLAGMFFRVQAYLFAGVGFLCLTVFTQIWHAAYDLEQSWLWWACGIVLGAAILALFALFEKRRPEVLRLLDDVKQWR